MRNPCGKRRFNPASSARISSTRSTFPDACEEPLGKGDVRDEEGFPRRVGKRADDRESAVGYLEHASLRDAQLPGQARLDEDGLRGGEQRQAPRGIFPGPLLPDVRNQLGVNGPVEKGVDPQDADQPAVFEAELPVQNRRKADHRRVAHEIGEDPFIERAGDPLDRVGRPAVEEFDGLTEAGQGGAGRKVHPHRRGDAAGDPHELQEGQAPAAGQVPQEGFRDAVHGVSRFASPAIAPSTISRTRSA